MEAKLCWGMGEGRKGEVEKEQDEGPSVGELLVVIGGLSRQGQATIDVLVFHLASLAAWRPAVHTWAGDALPRRRFRHTVALIHPPAALRAGGFAREHDPILFMFGGYDLEGNVHGMEEAFFLCLSDAGATATWRRAHTRGTVPSARFHHAMAAYENGSKVLVYGGEGLAVNDWDVVEGARQEGMLSQGGVAWERVWNSVGGGHGNGRARRPGGEEGHGEGGHGEGGQGGGGRGEGGRALVVYVLDVSSLTWSRVPTHGVCPGVRILHFATTYNCGASGTEHMVIFGGYRDDSTNLETMQPYALNLASMEWRRARSSSAMPAHLPESLRAPAYQPVARNRSGLTKIGNDTLLLTEGTIYDTRSYLRDVHALHLPSLSWSPVRAHGQPTAGPSGGLSAEGLIAYGGCVLGEFFLSLSVWQQCAVRG
ncbi:unnamed protein product [Closterium sp. Yama58-4]|nr:unnamed protein product [Closterium sp. Yama58-4]